MLIAVDQIPNEPDDGNGRGPFVVRLAISLTEGPFVDGVAKDLSARNARRIVAAFGADVLSLEDSRPQPAQERVAASSDVAPTPTLEHAAAVNVAKAPRRQVRMP